jgi:hypothetical protein
VRVRVTDGGGALVSRARAPVARCRQLDALFDSVDKDGSGAIDYRELAKVLRATRRRSSVDDGANESSRQDVAERSRVLRGTTLSGEADLLAELTAALQQHWARVSELFHEVCTARPPRAQPRVCWPLACWPLA